MENSDACVKRECNILDRSRVGPYRFLRRKAFVASDDHCPADSVPANEQFEED
ncbi:MAG: hypothetical protein JW839_13085 [Candidatus Lokiarchaeota archaeon]|nr:hypothetical protein [Candidatus Lokiarchaeota archaeon]